MTDGRDRLVVSLPVLFVDEVLPTLKDTELRVLLVVLRQIHIAGRERTSAWLTHRELKKRTGRASEAVSAAIESLSGKGLLTVCDETGKRLVTAHERQLAGGRRFYSVPAVAPAKAKHDPDKPKTIDINTNKHYSFRFSDADGCHNKGEDASTIVLKAEIRNRLSKLSS